MWYVLLNCILDILSIMLWDLWVLLKCSVFSFTKQSTQFYLASCGNGSNISSVFKAFVMLLWVCHTHETVRGSSETGANVSTSSVLSFFVTMFWVCLLHTPLRGEPEPVQVRKQKVSLFKSPVWKPHPCHLLLCTIPGSPLSLSWDATSNQTWPVVWRMWALDKKATPGSVGELPML